MSNLLCHTDPEHSEEVSVKSSFDHKIPPYAGMTNKKDIPAPVSGCFFEFGICFLKL
jgi:hypothetical protein